MMRGNLGRHDKSNVYKDWQNKYAALPCISDITRTQGLIEKHNDSLKHIYLNKNNECLDAVIPSLFVAHVSLKR